MNNGYLPREEFIEILSSIKNEEILRVILDRHRFLNNLKQISECNFDVELNWKKEYSYIVLLKN